MTPGGGAFSLPVDLDDLAYVPCVLKAYPSPEAVPADPSPFTGPLVLAQQLSTYKRLTGGNTGAISDFYYAFGQTRSSADFYSITSCGLCDLGWVDTTTARPLRARDSWETGAAFYDFLDAAKTKTDATIDGHKTLWSDDVSGDVFKDYANFPAITTTGKPADGITPPAFTESVEPVRCQDDAWTERNAVTCTSFTKLGVRLDRTFTSAADGRTWHLEDRYTSVDGQQHDLDLHYTSYANTGGTGGGGMSVPWSGTPGFVTIGGTPETWSFDAPATLPASVFVDNGLEDPDGSPNGPAGALTVGPRVRRGLRRRVQQRGDPDPLQAHGPGGRRDEHQDGVLRDADTGGGAGRRRGCGRADPQPRRTGHAARAGAGAGGPGPGRRARHDRPGDQRREARPGVRAQRREGHRPALHHLRGRDREARPQPEGGRQAQGQGVRQAHPRPAPRALLHPPGQGRRPSRRPSPPGRPASPSAPRPSPPAPTAPRSPSPTRPATRGKPVTKTFTVTKRRR